MDERYHQDFLRRLDASQQAVWTYAAHLQARGQIVTIPPFTRARTHAEWADHVDLGDLYVSHRIEVKQLSRNFTSLDDWPFYDRFIVCAQHAFDNASPKPYAHIIFSADLTHGARLMTTTRPQWRIESIYNSKVNAERAYYVTHPKHAVFFQL